MFKAYRCQICGESYLGEMTPDRCPFCGAHERYLMTAAEWMDYGAIELSEQSREDCERALELEMNNMAFYKCAAAVTENQVMQSFFKRLSKQEGEHAELIAEMMGVDEPEAPDVECSDDDYENMKEAHRRETRAIKFYQQVARRAPELRVQQVFSALTDVENEHLMISGVFKH